MSKAISHNDDHIIKIVPLHTAKRTATGNPQLTYRNGPLLQNVEVFTIFWGTQWSTRNTEMDHINSFFTAILKSSLIQQLTEYNTPGFTIGNGTLTGTIVITAGAPTKNITDAKIQLQLNSWIKANTSFPQPGANTLYFIYTDSGITVSMGGSKSCSSFCGYHNATKNNIYYAVMPYPDCAGCQGGLAVQDALTATSSHEMCESITDPVPGSGWYDDANGEIGDICAWKFKDLDGFKVQLEWSNSHNSCM